MDLGYLFSIVDLYLKKEKDNKKTTLNIKKNEDKIEFSFGMKLSNEKTTFQIPFEIVNSKLNELLNIYKQDMMIIDEKYNYDNAKNTCYYYVLFKNGRTLSFDGFSILEINNIRNVLYNIRINTEEIRVNLKEEKEMVYKPKLNLQQAGFASYTTIFLIALFFVDIFVIALWICKILMK